MSHTTRVHRHLVVDLLAATAAGSLVTAITTRSWGAIILAVFAGIALYINERDNIQEEDQLDCPAVPPKRPLTLTVADVKILAERSLHPASINIPVEGLAFYVAGLEDGAATTSQWVLNQLEDSE